MESVICAPNVDGAFDLKAVNPGTYSLQFYCQRHSGKGHLYLDAQEFWLTVDPNETMIETQGRGKSDVDGTFRRRYYGRSVDGSAWDIVVTR